MRRSVGVEVVAGLEPWALGQVGSIEQFGGLEVNSSNYRVSSEGGTWLVKRVPAEAGPDLASGLEIWRWLASAGREVPVPIPSATGQLTCRLARYEWSVTEFVPGNFFHTSVELETTARAIGRLHATLRGLPRHLQVGRTWTYDFVDAEWLLSLAARDSKAWSRLFGDVTAERLSKFASAMPWRLDELRLSLADSSIERQLSHGDLHPHNVLVREGEPVAFVDAESMVVIPAIVAYSFARFKLVRQAVCAELADAQEAECRARQLSVQFRHAVESEDPRRWPDRVWREAAESELVRRIFVILRGNYVDGDTRWNRVLETQLRGLDELAAMAPATHE